MKQSLRFFAFFFWTCFLSAAFCQAQEEQEITAAKIYVEYHEVHAYPEKGYFA